MTDKDTAADVLRACKELLQQISYDHEGEQTRAEFDSMLQRAQTAIDAADQQTNPDLRPARLTTTDIGFAIRDFLETRAVSKFIDRGDHWHEESQAAEIESVDVSDPDNPLVYLDNGQVFRIRIFAAG